jgi:hypothetical protein
MSLNKKDEDETGILKVDRTSVFQEGEHWVRIAVLRSTMR